LRGAAYFAGTGNRMTSATTGGVTTTFVYNPDGIRLSKATNGVTTSYVWDIAAGPPVIIQETTGANTTTYTYGRGLICTTTSSGAQLYRLTDGLGSTINLADGAGNVLMTYGYGVFGDLRFKYGSAPTDRLFTGEQRDLETGLDYLRARYYDPATGRFLGSDPLGGGYAYAGNNPANRRDPTGLYEICGDNPDWGYICFDSTEVGLPAEAPSSCDIGANVCTWDSGFVAPYTADGGNEVADQVASAVAGCASGDSVGFGNGAMCGNPQAGDGGGGGCNGVQVPLAGCVTLSDVATAVQIIDIVPIPLLCAPLGPGAVAACIVADQVVNAVATAATIIQIATSDCGDGPIAAASLATLVNFEADLILPEPVQPIFEGFAFGVSTGALSC